MSEDANGRVDALVREVGQALDDGWLPLEILNDPDVYRTELERIFARTWQFVGHVSEVPEPGDYARRYIGEDPYIFVRDEEGEIRVLYDSCCHRGAQFARAEQGNTSHFRCPYHGWTYRNNGELVGMPYKEEAYKELDPEEVRLTEAEVDTYAGLAFARVVEGGPSLDEYLGDFAWYLDMAFDVTEAGMTVVGEPHRVRADHDWKISAENFGGDSYHVLTTHQSSMELEYAGENVWDEVDDFVPPSFLFCTDRHSGGYYLLDDDGVFMDYPDEFTDHLNPELSEEQRTLLGRSLFNTGTVFPNMSFWHGVNQVGGPWANIRVWQPRGPGETEVVNWWLVPEELSDDEAFVEEARAGYESLSPGGIFESDDLEVWSGISESAGAVTARERNFRGNVQLGMGGMSEVERVDADLHGPAEVTNGGLYFDERNARTIYGAWHRYMTENVEA
jgi:phenylpropionate dioxygenase-like ring-hydroxylating dioxygenase large terminal subunit